MCQFHVVPKQDFYWKCSQCKKIITWRKTHSSSTTHKIQEVTLFFWERHKKINNLFITMEFTFPECKRYCRGKHYIMQISNAWGGHTIHFTAEDHQLSHLSLTSKQKHLTSKKAGHPNCQTTWGFFYLLLPVLGYDFVRLCTWVNWNLLYIFGWILHLAFALWKA